MAHSRGPVPSCRLHPTAKADGLSPRYRCNPSASPEAPQVSDRHRRSAEGSEPRCCRVAGKRGESSRMVILAGENGRTTRSCRSCRGCRADRQPRAIGRPSGYNDGFRPSKQRWCACPPVECCHTTVVISLLVQRLGGLRHGMFLRSNPRAYYRGRNPGARGRYRRSHRA